MNEESSNKANAYLFQYVIAQRFAHNYSFFKLSVIGLPSRRRLGNYAGMEFFYREHQIPVLTPYAIAILNSETTELAFIEILVILRMRVTAYEVTYIHPAGCLVAKKQIHRQISGIFLLL